ncbi:MAG: helix-turn-helix domain-containing protein [Oscillospiraceae bacterium]|nr:helix-turn-helix domain-containing protein [Oscillospiraceae bacterium]
MLGKQLKKLRSQRELTQQQVANCLHVSTSTYGLWEQGRNEPDIKTLIQLSDFFGVTIDYLLGRKSYSTTEQQAIQNLITASEIITENLKLLLEEKQN